MKELAGEDHQYDNKKSKKPKTESKNNQDDSEEEASKKKKRSRVMSRRIPPISPPRKLGEIAKQDATDEEMVCHSLSNESELTEPWSLPLVDLWQHKPTNFEAEQAYNLACSQRDPCCAVCALFSPVQIPTDEPEKHAVTEVKKTPPKKSGKKSDSTTPPKKSGKKSDSSEQRTLPLIPEMCFASSTENPNPLGSNTVLDADGLSPLLHCEDCKICVHASCYGVPENMRLNPWRCSRCVRQNLEAVCCLCCLRGGALKPTTNGKWVHIVCTLVIPEVKFENIELREPISIGKITSARSKLRCMFCYPLMKDSEQPGFCVQCSSGRCTLSFHVTCAHVAGVTFETSDWPFPVYITCPRHVLSNNKVQQRDLKEVKVGDEVYAKHKNSRYYKADVVESKNQVFYEVDFDDGSFSDNLFPQDIESHHCEENGPPPVSTVVQVRWTDGELYGAVFTGSNSHTLYTVEFEDGSERAFKREELWLEDEELPKHVKSKLSKATERKYDIFYTDQGHLPSGRRRPKPKICYRSLLG